MQSVLVTGGAGFIGSHLCKSLLEDGYQVVCLDNLITGSKKNIEDLLDNPNFGFVEADVCQRLENIEELKNIDFIFHLASPASPIDYQDYPEETLLVNSTGTLKC
jgi:nucleoside-diphosphate-sugar epimerase